MKVIKPQLLSLLTRPFLFRSRQRLAVTTLAGFALGDGRRLLPETALWPILAEATGGLWDEGLPKVRGEVLLFGSCHNPGGVARPVTLVRLQVGPLTKRLAVIGNRVWDGATFTEPEPFAEMPLTWEHAFGGPELARNPRGKGIAKVTLQGREGIPLPNLEDPDHLIRTRRDRPEPVGFGPLDILWPQRQKKAGTYDKSYLEHHFPGFPPDVQPDFFQLAPPDQWIDGTFGGDEAYLLENLHPSQARLEGRLPGMRARCFARRRSGPPFEEIDMRLETVVLLPDREVGVLVFRGVLAIAEDDAADVLGLFAASEALQAPRPAAHYHRAFERRLDKDEGLLLALDDQDLVPDFAATPARPTPAPAADPTRERTVGAVRRQLAEHGLNADAALAGAAPPAAALPQPAGWTELAALEERLTASLAEKTAALPAKAEQAVAAGRKEIAAARARRAGPPPQEPPAAEPAPPGGPPAPLADEMLAALGERAPGLAAKLRAADAEALEMYRQTAHHAPPAATRAADPARLRALRERLAAGASLAEVDLTGCDLSSLPLEKADLRRALLASVRLSRSHLGGANLAGAVLAHADLEGARLEGCNAQDANLGGARLEGTRFDRANLRGAVLDEAWIHAASFQGADLAEASLLGASMGEVTFEGARAPAATFQKMDLGRCRFTRAHLAKANFLETRLDGADFSEADLELVTLLAVSAAGTSFARARLRGLHAVMGCSFAGADFEGADLEGAFLRGCNLEGANLSGARLVGADLSECRLRGARLSRAQAREALFVRAELDDATLEHANLMQTLLQKATLFGANLSGCNLFGANLGQIRLDTATKLTGSNLKRVLLHPKAGKPQ